MTTRADEYIQPEASDERRPSDRKLPDQAAAALD